MYPKKSPSYELNLIKYFLKKARYDSSLNQFFWTENRVKKTLGKRVGGLNHSEYWILKFRHQGRYVHLFEHRLIWFVHTGEIPDEIDHLNGDRSDNRISNLRNVDRGTNAKNLKRHRSGQLWGVRWEANAWRARFRFKNKHIHVGRFENQADAFEAVLKEARRVGIIIP